MKLFDLDLRFKEMINQGSEGQFLTLIISLFLTIFQNKTGKLMFIYCLGPISLAIVIPYIPHYTVKPFLSGHSKRRPKLVVKIRQCVA